MKTIPGIPKRRRSAVIATAITAAALATVGLAACGGSTDLALTGATSTPATSTPTRTSAGVRSIESTIGLTITVQNKSSWPIQYIRDGYEDKHEGKITRGPAPVLLPGQADTVTYESNNASGGEVDLIYRPMDTTKAEYDGRFIIPTLGPNAASCAGTGAPQLIQVPQSECTITGGWSDVKANLSFTDKTPTPIYAIQKTDAPNTQLLEEHGFKSTDGSVVDTWQRKIDESGIQYNQQWAYRPTGNGTAGQLIRRGTDECIEVDPPTGAILEEPCSTTGAANQVWTIVQNGDGSSALQVTLGTGNHWAPGTYYLATTTDPQSVANGTPLTLTPDRSNRTSWDLLRL